MAVKRAEYTQKARTDDLAEEFYRKMDNLPEDRAERQGFYLQSHGMLGTLATEPFICFHYEKENLSAGIIINGSNTENPVRITGTDEAIRQAISGIEELTEIELEEVLEEISPEKD